MLINKAFLRLQDRYCLEKVYFYACTHAYECADIDICSYPNLSKELITQERPCCSQRKTPDLKKYVISIQSYVYNEMITFFPIKVSVKKYSNLDCIRQAKNTYLTSSTASFWLKSRRSFRSFSLRCRCKKTHTHTHRVSECTTVSSETT
jgi:hypothetical protein